MKTPASSPFYVALIEGGVPKFSENPVGHKLRGLARKEAERLATVHPGKTFQVFRIDLEPSTRPTDGRMISTALAFYVEPKPKVKTYTGEELFTTAPNGDYRTRTGAFVARVHGPSFGNRAVLFVGDDGYIEGLNRRSWGHDEFTKVA